MEVPPAPTPPPAGAQGDVWEVVGDNRCLLRAYARGIYDPAGVYHRNQGGEPQDVFLRNIEVWLADTLREKAVETMSQRPERYRTGMEEGEGGEWEKYLESMAQTNTWGDQVVTQALADLTGIPAVTYMKQNNNAPPVEMGMLVPDKGVGRDESGGQQGASIVLTYNGRNHYQRTNPSSLGSPPELYTSEEASRWRAIQTEEGNWQGPEVAEGDLPHGLEELGPGVDQVYGAITIWIVQQYERWINTPAMERTGTCRADKARTAWTEWGGWVRAQGWKSPPIWGVGRWEMGREIRFTDDRRREQVGNHRQERPLTGYKVTITHEMAPPGKVVLQRQIRQAGGEIGEKFSETTTHVIVGTPAPGARAESRTWQRAKEKNEGGGGCRNMD